MSSKLIPFMVCSIVIWLLSGCSERQASSDKSSSRENLHFETTAHDGLTTDHASTGGVSWVDYDGDGDLDLFVTNGYDVSAETPVGQRNRLYRNDGQAGFAEITTGPLATSLSISSGHTWGDYDNDGDLDVFITNQQDQNNLLFRNEGGGSFVQVTDEPMVSDGGHSYTAAWVDVDSDGWLDLFVANGGMSHSGRNCLYRGTGGGRFQKITEGDLVTAEAASCGIAWGDYDNDGDPDLFVANQGFSPPANHNVLYRNNGGWSFARVENAPVATDGLPACAATWVDVDNDLDLDLHVTVMYGLANLLYINDGVGNLSLLEGSPVTIDGGHSYGANWEDYDLDGDRDLVVANWGAGPVLYRNQGGRMFERIAGGGLGSQIKFAGAIASGDYDGDGDLDIYIGNWPNHPGDGELNTLFQNQTGGGHWLRVKLIGTESNRSGIGARVLVTFRHGRETITQMHELSAQMGFRGQSSLSPTFGLGEAEEAVRLEVRWPSGQVTVRQNVPADQFLEVAEHGSP